jgi:hypothetical protein
MTTQSIIGDRLSRPGRLGLDVDVRKLVSPSDRAKDWAWLLNHDLMNGLLLTNGGWRWLVHWCIISSGW